MVREEEEEGGGRRGREEGTTTVTALEEGVGREGAVADGEGRLRSRRR
jgi:hypothetical protein